MMAKAIGPQNTSAAIGMNPSTVEIAVSMMGRKRESVASTTASQACGLCVRSVSICSMRRTALRAIMPNRARMPRMATKPSGLPTISRVKTMPIRPIGITLTTRNRRLKLCSCAIRKNSMSSSIRAPWRRPRPANWRFPRPCRRRRCGSPWAGSARNFSIAGASASTAPQASASAATSASTVRVGTRWRRQISGIFLLEIERRDLAQRHGAAVRQRQLQGAQRRQRAALFVERPRDDGMR